MAPRKGGTKRCQFPAYAHEHINAESGEADDVLMKETKAPGHSQI